MLIFKIIEVIILDKYFDLGDFYNDFYTNLPAHLLALECYRYLENTSKFNEKQASVLLEACAYKFCHMYNFSDYTY